MWTGTPDVGAQPYCGKPPRFIHRSDTSYPQGLRRSDLPERGFSPVSTPPTTTTFFISYKRQHQSSACGDVLRRHGMKFNVERDALADAVAWTAKSLPSRPSVPVLAGVLLRVADGHLMVSGFDYEVSSQVSVEVQADADGAALVSGRLLAEITKALPAKPVDIAAVGAHLELVCGSARFTLPT